ncbi:Protein of unknown function [Mesobacillus persicus]|uniref:UPF0344 protein SAMN05192533_10411 n=1 Tax=Mesobacillus persicus TaxID=930146 RepID=A0A1H7ZMT9_9BACI|nr:YisL family protein [Mesobacillus persicus]SEM59636.1 Protein of unknown function [Mesobacillus persicus]
MTHAHITAWVLSIILFIVIMFMQKQGKNTKVLHMILRVFYLLILATGIVMLFGLYQIDFMYILKSLLGIVLIGLFEMILVRGKKGINLNSLWIVFVLVFVIVLYLGFKLPLGFYLF